MGQPQEPEVPSGEEEEIFEGEPQGESEEERLAKRRIRPRNAEDQQVIDLYRSEGFEGSFADASRIIYGQNAQNQQAPQYAEPRAPAPEQRQDPLKAQAASLQTEIASLEKQVHAAAEELDTTKALSLQRLSRAWCRDENVRTNGIRKLKKLNPAEKRRRAGTGLTEHIPN